MRGTVALAWRLLRAGGRRDALTASLGVAAFAVTTALLLLVLAGNAGFASRAEHQAWRQPVPAGANAVAVEATDVQALRGRQVTVVEVAALRADAPAPPGLDRFPAPGEMWVSPALGRMLASAAPAEFADRFGARPAGDLGRAALAYPDELVAVVGQRADDPRMTTTRAASPFTPAEAFAPTLIASFAGRTESADARLYSFLTRFATALLVVPLLILGAAAARLGVSRRLARLAAMRLVGATPRQVVGLTAVESMAAAAVGALFGAVLYAGLVPLLARVELAGGAWFTADLAVPPLQLVAALVGMVLLGGLSAVMGLRGVVVSPLGVAQRQTPRRLRAVRALVFAVLVGVFSVVAGSQDAGVGVIVTALGVLFGSLALLGPWVVGILGRLVVACARGPATLLAGRRLVDDPRAAWRTVGGLTLAGFVAGFVAMVPDLGTAGEPAPADQLTVTVPAGTGTAAAARLDRRLAQAGLGKAVPVPRDGAAEGSRDGTQPPPPDLVTVTVSGGDEGMDRARTTIARALPGADVRGEVDLDAEVTQVIGDLRTGTVLVLAATFLVAMASAGITNAAAVLDRRRTYGQLRLAGTPLAVLDRARALETLVPLTVLGLGSVGLGVFCAAPLVQRGFGGEGGLAASGALELAVCVVAGLAGIVAASAASRPLLAAVTREPVAQPS